MKHWESIYELTDHYFKWIYLVHILIAANNVLCETVISRVFSVCVLACASIVLLGRLFQYRKSLHYPLFNCYILFLLSFVISMLVNLRYGIYYNIKILIWMMIQFGTLYLFDAKMKKENVLIQVHQVMKLLIACVSLINFIGIVMAFSHFINYRVLSEDVYFLIGFAPWGRLYGLNTDPNYSAAVTVVTMILAFYFWRSTVSSNIRKLYISSIVIQLIALAMGASRTGLVALLVSAFLYAFLHSRYQKIKIYRAVGVAFLAVILSFTSQKLIVMSFNTVMSLQSQLLQQRTDTEDKPITKISRETELSGDISNRRFSLWKDAIAVTKTAPVFGVTFGNFVTYAEANLPNSYMLTNDLTVFNAFHNMVMDLMASQGMVGLISFGVLVIASLCVLLRQRKKLNEIESALCICLFSACSALVVASMFTSCILYVNNQVTVLFWMLWGFLIYFMTSEEGRHE